MWFVYLKGTQHPSPYTEGRLFPHPLNSGLVEEFTMHIHLISVSCLLIYVHHSIQYPTLHIHVYRVITHRCLQCSAHWCLYRLKKLLFELSIIFSDQLTTEINTITNVYLFHCVDHKMNKNNNDDIHVV